MATQAPRLLEEFPCHSYEEWHAAAVALLKGADFEKRLVSKTHEGITIQPIYRREDIAGLEHRRHLPGYDSKVRGSKPQGHLVNGWEVSQELAADTPEELNRLVHEGLKGGQSELNIRLGCGQQECCTGGSPLTSSADYRKALQGVQLDAVATYLQPGPSVIPAASLFFSAANALGFDSLSLRGGVENDPYAELLAAGSLRQTLESRLDHSAALTRFAIAKAPRFHTLTVKGDVHHNAGGSATQELGHAIATLVALLEAMKQRGLEPAAVLPHVRLRLAVGSDYFMEIAKIRAARWLWQRVATAYGVDDAPVHIHASTSRWNKTAYDAHTNMLRVTAEAFAAVVAGVDSLHIGTYDEVAGSSDVFSRRIARNLHTLLREECGLDQVIDPAGGSYYIEWLTDQVASHAWQVFQAIESKGGLAACIEDGSLQQQIAAVRSARIQGVRLRRERIVGTNMYPDLKGRKLETREIECRAREAAPMAPKDLGIPSSGDASLIEAAIAAADGGALKFCIQHSITLGTGQPAAVEPLGSHRAAAEYEALRDASNAHAVKTGSPPAILQLNMGPSRRYRLRADWTASFFEAAGFAVDGAVDFDTIEDAVAALGNSVASIAVITSDDDTYAELAADLAKAVKSARGDVLLLLAGAPGEHEAGWREAGIDDFVHVRSNNYEMNHALLQKAGVL